MIKVFPREDEGADSWQRIPFGIIKGTGVVIGLEMSDARDPGLEKGHAQ